jgi:hypothetical protein
LIQILSGARLDEIAAELGIKLPGGSREKRADTLAEAVQKLEPVDFFGRLRRDELRSACRARGLPGTGRSRAELTSRLVGRAVDPDSVAAWFRPWHPLPDEAGHRPPRRGQIVRVRQRQYLVEDVVERTGEMTRVRLVGLDDDDAGQALDILWELELEASVIVPEEHGLGQTAGLDSPQVFAAYYHSLAWGCTTSTNAQLFQAPFRAGIKIQKHQLVPLRKALELPRVNLFIADDVGVGKTIEAALVLQELLLRNQVDRVLVVCPASITLQWRDELERRFGLRFEVYGRRFIAERREERGFGVPVWGTFPRFIVSYQTLRRPEHWEPLLAQLGDQARRTLLILDEAHTAAPASASKYAFDSQVTKAIRHLAPLFEHRLFLSATPHNGHSNSFSSLLEILDPQRFTRGVPVDPSRLAPVMVRRLKIDLIRRGFEGYPERRVRQIELRHEDGTWAQEVKEGGRPLERESLGRASDVELELSRLLAQYRTLVDARGKRGRLVLVNLQKRLLSSVEAFARTLAIHTRSVGLDRAAPADIADYVPESDDVEDRDDEVEEAEQDLLTDTGSRTFPRLSIEARRCLEQMGRLAERGRREPNAKVLSLLAWIRREQCPAVAVGGADRKLSRHWSDRRLIVFTEYIDSKRYVRQLLDAAIDGTDDAEERILELHGGLPEDRREEISRAFNGDPQSYPVRILLATDAAREGINLHGRCADLLHWDVPWNPARLEQRNGRIDRALQREKTVRCYYFVYPQRHEDVVLQKLVEKSETIRKELGSLGEVVMERLEGALAAGIEDSTAQRVDGAAVPDARESAASQELEASVLADVREEELVGEILNASQEILSFSPALLKTLVDAGLELMGFGRLRLADPDTRRSTSRLDCYALPDIDPNGSWAATLDTLRFARGRDEAFWEWRQRPLKPVVFTAPNEITEQVVHLHLQHPLVQRIVSRFRAQGWAAHDLGRVTVVRNPDDALVRVVAIGRLALFGPGAIRLHEELISVAARWSEGKGSTRLRPFAEKADRKAVEQLQRLLGAAPASLPVPKPIQAKLAGAASADFAALWPHVRAEADSRQNDAETKLQRRGRSEAEAMRHILADQRRAIERTLAGKQLALVFSESEWQQRQQYEADRKHMSGRLDRLVVEETEEPARIARRYEVVLKRVEPVGLVYLYPEVG